MEQGCVHDRRQLSKVSKHDDGDAAERLFTINRESLPEPLIDHVQHLQTNHAHLIDEEKVCVFEIALQIA